MLRAALARTRGVAVTSTTTTTATTSTSSPTANAHTSSPASGHSGVVVLSHPLPVASPSSGSASNSSSSSAHRLGVSPSTALALSTSPVRCVSVGVSTNRSHSVNNTNSSISSSNTSDAARNNSSSSAGSFRATTPSFVTPLPQSPQSSYTNSHSSRASAAAAAQQGLVSGGVALAAQRSSIASATTGSSVAIPIPSPRSYTSSSSKRSSGRHSAVSDAVLGTSHSRGSNGRLSRSPPFLWSPHSSQQRGFHTSIPGLLTRSAASESTSELSDSSNDHVDAARKLLLGFTCTVCDTRQHKTISHHAYHKGVVLIRCDGCENNHLIADNLGWFRDTKTNIEDLLKEKGESITKIMSEDNTLELFEGLDAAGSTTDNSSGSGVGATLAVEEGEEDRAASPSFDPELEDLALEPSERQSA